MSKCQRCGLSGAKRYNFSELGFQHFVILCQCCAWDESDIGVRSERYERERKRDREKVQNDKSVQSRVLQKK